MLKVLDKDVFLQLLVLNNFFVYLRSMNLKEKIKRAPKYPGCYLFKDEKGQIIYVGMSKFLPKRVNSYFTKKHTDFKTTLLVETIKDVEFQISSSEEEALILEEELIKLYMPKFNMKGKDDRTRKWSITFTEESFPKLEVVKNKTDNRPSLDFTGSQLAYEVYDLIHDIFELRSCSYELSDDNISSGKFKPCLEYQMKRCNAPCIGNETIIEYLKSVFSVKQIFDLEFNRVKKFLKSEMNKYSKTFQYERANDFLNKIKSIDTLEKKLESVRLRQYNKKLFEIKRVLKLNNLPSIIEAFDNSHNQGDSNVSASVRYENGKPKKNEYRKYIIKKEGNKGDDYASFEEVVFRRFKRLLDEKKTLPHLVLIDGGVGQLNVVKGVFDQLGITNQVDLISISKDNSHRSSVIHTTDGNRIDILSNNFFTVLGEIQEEIHRFVIKFHREKEGKKMFE
jgi:excinuclease UvrABC nuclease subunit